MIPKLKDYLTGNEKLLQIIWTDSWNPEYGWCDIHDLDTGEYFVHTVGILVDETEESIIVASAQGVTNPTKIINQTVIPKCCIKHQKELK